MRDYLLFVLASCLTCIMLSSCHVDESHKNGFSSDQFATMRSEGKVETIASYESGEIEVLAVKCDHGLSAPFVFLSGEYFVPYTIAGIQNETRAAFLKVTENEAYLLLLAEFDIGTYWSVLSSCKLIRKNGAWKMISRESYRFPLSRNGTIVFSELTGSFGEGRKSGHFLLLRNQGDNNLESQRIGYFSLTDFRGDGLSLEITLEWQNLSVPY